MPYFLPLFSLLILSTLSWFTKNFHFVVSITDLHALFVLFHHKNSKKSWFLDMQKINGLLFCSLLLVSSSVFSHQPVAFGSAVSEKSFKRPDPFRGFKLYRGRFDVRDKHYWASAVFTGVHGYAISAIFLLSGLGFGTYMIIKGCCTTNTNSQPTEQSRLAYQVMFLMVVLLSLLSIVCTCLVITENQRSLDRTRKFKQAVLGAGSDARELIQRVTETVDDMHRTLLPYDKNISSLLNSTSQHLDRESSIIQSFVRKHDHSIDKAIQIMYIANLVVVTANLAFVLAAIVLFLFHWQPGFFIIILFCWIFTTLCWLLTGLDFFLHTFARDSCEALEDFEENPKTSSLSSIIPCGDSAHSEKILVDIGHAVHTVITELNSKITQFHRLLRIKKLCDPFSGAPYYSFVPQRSCSNDSIPVGEMHNVITKHTCYGKNPLKCVLRGKFIPEVMSRKALAYTYSLQGIINMYPDMQSLIQCSFLRDTFSHVILDHCRPYKASTRNLWMSMLFLSIFMMMLVLLCVAKAYQEKGRSFSACSITPLNSN